MEVGLQTVALRGVELSIPQSHLIFLGALIQNNKLVFLPVACFRVLRTLWRLHSSSLGEGSILAAAGLGRGVRLAV